MFTFILQLLLWCVLIMLPLSHASGSQCFRPNGALAENDHPCEPSHGQSFCCGVGWTCAFDKVCYPTNRLGSEWKTITPTRGSCTDSSWNSSECPNYCISSLDSLDGGQSFYQCPGSNPPAYCCHEEGCNCGKGGDFNLTSVASISLIAEPSASSTVLPTVRPVVTVVSSKTIISVVTTAPPTKLIYTNAADPSTTSQPSTSSSEVQPTDSQSSQVDQPSQAGAAPTKSGARKFGVNFVTPVVALAIGALVLLLFRY